MNDKGTNSAEIKDILLDDISICVKHLHFISIQTDTNETLTQPTAHTYDFENLDVITNETPSFQALIYQLDMILLHNLNRVDRGYWPFLKTFSHSNVVTCINQLTLVRSAIGKGRAWLHIALNDHLMESYFRLFLEDSKPIRSYYKPDAFIRDAERMKILQTHVSGLDFIKFELNTNCEYLDKRPCISTQYVDQNLQFNKPHRSRGSFISERDLESSISSISSITVPPVDRRSPQVTNPSPFLSEQTEDLDNFITRNVPNKNTIENGHDTPDELNPFITQMSVHRPVIESKRHYFSQENSRSQSVSNQMRKVSSLRDDYNDQDGGLVTHVGKVKKQRKHKKRENINSGIQRLGQSKDNSTWSVEDNGGSLADNSSIADTTSLVSDFADFDIEHSSYGSSKYENTLTAKTSFTKKSVSPIPLKNDNEYLAVEETKSTSSPSEMVILGGDNSSEDIHTGESIVYLNNPPTTQGSRHTTDISSLEEVSLDHETPRQTRHNEITLSDTSSSDAIIEHPSEKRIESPCSSDKISSHRQDESSDSSLSHIIERLEASKPGIENIDNTVSKSPSPILESIQEVLVVDTTPLNNPISPPYCSDTESEQHSRESKQNTPNVKPIKLETSIEQPLDEVRKPEYNENLTPYSDNTDFEGLLSNYLDTALGESSTNVPVNFAAFYSLDQHDRVTTEKVVGISLFDPSSQEGVDSILEGSVRDGADEPRNVTPLSFVDLNIGGDDPWEVENVIDARERSRSMFGEDKEFHSSSLIKRPDRETKLVEEVKISQNNQLMIRVKILLSPEEKILKVFRAFDSKYLGMFSIIYVLITDHAVYTMVEDGAQGTFCQQDAITFSNLDYITIGINWQLITIFKKNFTTLTCYTGNEQLSKCLLAGIRQGMAAGIFSDLSLKVVENDIKRIKKFCALLELKDHLEIKHFSIVTSGPLRGKFTSEDDEKDPGGYNHDIGLSGYLNWKKQKLFSSWGEGYFILKNSKLSQYGIKGEKQPKVVLDLKGGSAGCRTLAEEGDRIHLLEITSSDAISIKISMRNEKELICWKQGICEEVFGRGIQESKAHSQSTVMNCGLVLTPDILCLTLEHEECLKKLSLSYVMDLNQIQVEEGKPYCILQFDSIDWVICFSSEYELGRFERCLAFQWENVYKVDLTFTQVSDESILVRANQLMELMAGAAQRSDSVTRNRIQNN
ncbi:Pleckstrin homology domain-containing family M member 2-like [Oopsacas minuta]|uniref:Pleckstrin homology domain-containing family M member 2-like n=1 Tax=Oopsacas minuta TaxID=111878 RepID=A0AAV7JMS9_9METZ|nr:Pleckstrin homology domain-containing family M member 2-like [Oopsacas minuta]